jgi:IS605 OrfB family transposase
MKTTVRGVLINISKEKDIEINRLMTVFSSAVRYGFKRILEDKEKYGQMEKDISRIYGINIRQSKDALKKANQMIKSQKELLKENYNNYSEKVKTVETQIEKAKLANKINALNKKLDKRKKKQEYYKDHIDNGTIPKVIFGGRKNFIKRCKGQITNKQWKELRDNNYYSRGDKTKNGNPNLRIIVKNGMTFLEISTLNRDKRNWAVKIQVPLYLPQKLSKKTGKINGNNYRQKVLDYLETGEAYKVELIKKQEKIYCHITIDESKIKEYKEIYTTENGIIGIDTNPDGLALTRLDKNLNYRWSIYLKKHELLFARTNRRDNICGELAKQAIEIAKRENCGVSIEDLKFKNDIDVTRKFARIKNSFIYRKLLTSLETKAIKEEVQTVKVKPQYTSKIGLYKYSYQYGLNAHESAALVIGRRAFDTSEKVPKILKDKLLKEEEKILFNKSNNWKQWSIISKRIKMKGGETPGFWQRNRKNILDKA